MLIYFLVFAAFKIQISFSGDPDRCEEPLDPGPCQYYQTKWYWDKSHERCNEFYYGGCLGTRNRFDNKQECIRNCIFKEHNPASIPDLCLLDPDPGHCNDERRGQWWYYFNAVNGICEQFFYYGCGGNNNKFYSLYQCRKVCGERLSPQIACDRCDVRTSRCAQVSKYNYTCECLPGFERNVYNECVDVDECRQGMSECDTNAWCTNTVGGHTCECMAGYVGDGYTCSYVGRGQTVDDCNECSSDATCKGGICQCKVGFLGDGFNCTDVDECMKSPYPCDKFAECKNVQGSYICECLPGYAGNGFNCTQSNSACLEKFERRYQESCGLENWREHYYFNHDTKRCSLIWYDGCPGKSQNIFSTLSTCENMCEITNVLVRAEVCWDKFDPNYKNQCLAGEWQQRYYFDHASLTCRLFWYDGCQGYSRNMFDDLLTCQWLCEEKPRYNSKSCLQPFEEHYRDECNGGRWRQQYYYNSDKMKCLSFWYDGCKGASENIFQDEITCVRMCETPARSHAAEERERIYYKGKNPDAAVNMCEWTNPCLNGGTCRYDEKKQKSYCQCAPGYTHDNCTERIDNDPCAKFPCKNGGTCAAKVTDLKVTYECICMPTYGGINCESQPCEKNPCKNNGTCRVTRDSPAFFCDCPDNFGGKHCELPVSKTKPKYTKNTNMISSGRPEWIDELKRRNPKQQPKKPIKTSKNTKAGSRMSNDQPIYDDNETTDTLDENSDSEMGENSTLTDAGAELDAPAQPRTVTAASPAQQQAATLLLPLLVAVLFWA